MKSNPSIFLLKLTIFACTALMPCLVAYGVLICCGETKSLNHVINSQTKSEQVLFGLAYSNPVVSYKLCATLTRTPEVLALGTSRVMPFRDSSFLSPRQFYNAGGGVEQLSHFRHFLSKIPTDHQPRVLIIGLDQYFFNEQWLQNNVKQNKVYLKNINNHSDVLNISNTELLRVLKDVMLGKIPIRTIVDHNRRNIGINAIVKGDGFINDGSYHYGDVSNNIDNPKHHDYHYTDTLYRINSGVNRFEYGNELSSNSLEELKLLLEECHKRKIHVIALLPPYAHSIYVKMKLMGGKYQYLDKIGPKINAEFTKYGYSFFDFTDLATVGAGDNETTDGFHASESAYFRILNLMAAKDVQLQKYVKFKTDYKGNNFEY